MKMYALNAMNKMLNDPNANNSVDDICSKVIIVNVMGCTFSLSLSDSNGNRTILFTEAQNIFFLTFVVFFTTQTAAYEFVTMRLSVCVRIIFLITTLDCE